jgi:hypothetical protein
MGNNAIKWLAIAVILNCVAVFLIALAALLRSVG